MIILMILLLFIMRNLPRFFYRLPNTTGSYLLLLAHPDDESMFFSPTLLNLKGDISILCLSDGGNEGLGDLRKKEMALLCSKNKYKLIQRDFIDNDNWDVQKIVNCLYVTYLLNPFKTLITFDSGGVSGHKNHISCYLAAKEFYKEVPCNVKYLKTTSFISKYLINLLKPTSNFIVPWSQYLRPIQMMMVHRSQLVWFRILWVLLSNYLSYNYY